MSQNKTLLEQVKGDDEVVKQLIQWGFIIFSLVILLISSSTSFGFFYTYFGNLLPEGFLESTTSRVISGLTGTTLFDVSAFVWLIAYLVLARTAQQRAVALLMSFIAFIGATSASVGYIGLNATGELALSPMVRSIVAVVSLLTIMGGVVANFGAGMLFYRFSYENIQKVRESNRRDRLQVKESTQANKLDTMVEGEIDKILQGMIPELAAEKAKKLAQDFRERESGRTGDPDPN